MHTIGSEFTPALLLRTGTAFLAMTATSTLLYSLVSFGLSVAPLQLTIAGVFALLLSAFVALPMAVIGARLGHGRRALALTVGLFLFAVFFIWHMVEMTGSTQLVTGGRSLVVDGKITLSGYWIAARDSLITALTGMAGFAVFLFVAPMPALRAAVSRSGATK